jgi:hypothetical protein
MGKAGKARKRQRLEGLSDAIVAVTPLSEPSTINEEQLAISISMLELLSNDTSLYASKGYKMLRKLLFPLIQVQLDKHFEGIPYKNAVNQIELNETNMKILENTINYFVNNLEVFQALQYKQFRRALHPLVMYTKKNMNGTVVEKSDQSISNQITSAYRSCNYSHVYRLLLQLANSNDEGIKLGHLQRWTRECDLLSKPNVCTSYTESQLKNMSLLLLYAVLRVMNNRNHSNSTLLETKLPENGMEMESMEATLVTHPYFSAVDVNPSDDSIQPVPADRDYGSDIVIIQTTHGNERRPPRYALTHSLTLAHSLTHSRLLTHSPSQYDLNIYMTKPNTIIFSSQSAVKRHNVPHVPGAFILTNVLTPSECAQFIRIAEQIQYTPDAVDGIDNIQWLASDDITTHLFSRCETLLPAVIPSINGYSCVLRGINARFRLFRYTPGSVYRPHIDGAWPGSGLVNGCFSDDAFEDRLSKLTFLVYLNDGFDGGGKTPAYSSAYSLTHS